MDLGPTEQVFVEYYVQDYESSGVNDPLQLCAIKGMWKFLKLNTKKFQYEVLITQRAANQKVAERNKVYLENLFHMPLEELFVDVAQDLAKSNTKAFQECVLL